MVPTSLLLLPPYLGYPLLVISCAFCYLNCRAVVQSRPSLALQALTALWWLLPFSLPLYSRMTPLEFNCMLVVVILKGFGTTIFVRKWPDPCPAVCGYHEIFHVLVIAAGYCIFRCNLSIVARVELIA